MANNLDEWFNEAIHFLNEDNVPEARKFLAKMKSTAPNDSRTIEIEGDCAKAEGDFDLATQLYRKLINGSDSQAAARGNLSLGFLLMERGERQEALKALIAAAPLLENRESPYEHMNAMSSIAALEYELGDFAQSAQTLLGVLEKYEEYELDDDCSLIYLSCATQRGDALRSLGKLDEAQEAYQIVADITEELEIMDEHANALDGIGVVHQMRGNFKEATNFHLKSVEINEEIESIPGLCANMANLARVYLHLEDWPVGRKYALRLLQLETDEESVEGVGFAKLLLAECDIGMKKYKEADQTLQSLLKIFTRSGEADTYVNLISVLGQLRRLQGNLEEAERYQNESLKISLEMNNRDFLLSSYDELAEIKAAQKCYDEARDLWEQALEIAEELKSAKMLKTIKKRLTDIAKL
jgi:tetratricopeptide (TPR) repeat protein